MRARAFDRIAGTAFAASVLYAAVVAWTSWEWFPTPGDWGDIARLQRSWPSYLALLLPPLVLLAWLLVRRLQFRSEL